LRKKAFDSVPQVKKAVAPIFDFYRKFVVQSSWLVDRIPAVAGMTKKNRKPEACATLNEEGRL
jgi:hypothetical protein